MESSQSEAQIIEMGRKTVTIQNKEIPFYMFVCSGEVETVFPKQVNPRILRFPSVDHFNVFLSEMGNDNKKS